MRTANPPGEEPCVSPGEEPCVPAGERAGWLSKRSRFSLRWRPTWFLLRGGLLLYGEPAQEPVKSIPLVGAELGVSGDPLGWTITPQDSKRRYHLRASSPWEQEGWVRSIQEAQGRGPQGSCSCSCSLQ